MHVFVETALLLCTNIDNNQSEEAWVQVRKRENFAATFHKHKYSHQLIRTNPSADRLDAPLTPQNTSQYKHILMDATISRLGPIISPIILTGIQRS